ncbi:MAG: OmpA family protein [Myxococcota bacterium]
MHVGKRSPSGFRASPIALLLALVGAWPISAQAQESGTLSRFQPSETTQDDFQISRPIDFGHLRFGFQLHVDYANDPLVFETQLGSADSESLAIVSDQLTGTLGLALGIVDRLVIFGGLPVVFVMDGADTVPVGVAGADDFGLGDAYLGARVRLVGGNQDIGSVALQLTATFPTAGNDQAYRGDEFLSVHPELVASLRPGIGARIVLNAGVNVRESVESDGSNLTFSDELTFGLGLAIPVWTDGEDRRTHLDLHAQAYGATALDEFFGREETALEATGGVKFHHATGLIVGAAAGPGFLRGFGSPDVRILGVLGFGMPEDLGIVPDTDGDGLLDDVDQCVQEPEDIDSFEDENGCPDPDNDNDGILDSADACPLEPETVNDVEDTDGCPDAVGDSDGDGITDDVDACEDQPEDVDGFEDTDGCPDPDNDGDGVLDGADNCPDVAGPLENRGCPDADRDNDTVVDRLDNCPDEPGPPENQGCEEEQQVVIAEGRLEILDAVYFRTGSHVIRNRSYPLLDNVAQVINNHPEIARIRVEGHTDSRGRREYNVGLSQRRAESVVEYLVENGQVEQSRLEAQGFGPDRPVVENARTREEHARNRRVEFNIPDTEGIEQTNSGSSADTVDQ